MLETINAVAAVGTFLVIGATAVVALVQLRHMRVSNQLEGLLSVLARVEDANFNTWLTETQRQLPKLMSDPQYVQSVLDNTFDRNVAWLQLGNSYDWVGSLVKNRLIPRDPFLDVYAFRVTQAWDLMKPITVLARHNVGELVWENFEYLAVVAQQWLDNPRRSSYPKHIPHATLPPFEEFFPDLAHVAPNDESVQTPI